MIQKNITTLSKIAWQNVVSPSFMRVRGGKCVWDVNMLINEKTGSILNVSYQAPASSNAVSLPVVLKEMGHKSYVIDLTGAEGDLQAPLRGVVLKSIEQYNQAILGVKAKR